MNILRELFTKPWLYVLIVVIGTTLKFYHLNYKLFWRDEISTVLYTSGVKEKDYFDNIPLNQAKNISFYDSLIHPRSKKNTITTEVRQILSDTHLTPAHYVFLTFWYRAVGDETVNFRLFSVAAFLLSLPVLFLLVKRLFINSLTGWIAVSLYAVSPFLHYHVQEARYYILWVFFFIVSTYLFLSAIDRNKLLWWIAYSIATVLALYTSLLSVVFIFGQLLYVFLFYKPLRTSFVFSLLFIVLAYLPWLYFLYTVRHAIEGGLSWQVYQHPSVLTLELPFFQLLGWSRGFTFLADEVYYFLLYIGSLKPPLYFPLIIDLLVIGFIVYAIVHLVQKGAKKTAWFLILTILSSFFFFYIADIIRNGVISGEWRYQITNMVAIIIVVAGLLTDKINSGRSLYGCFYLGFALLCILSVLRIEANRHWSNSDDRCIINIAPVIRSEDHPLILTDFGGMNGYGFVNFLTILNEAKPQNADILYCTEAFTDLDSMISQMSYSNIFVLQASDRLVQSLQSAFGERVVLYQKEEDPWSPLYLWQIKR